MLSMLYLIFNNLDFSKDLFSH